MSLTIERLPKQIMSSAGEISKISDKEERSRRISLLSTQIFTYTNHFNLEDPKCRFFVHEIKDASARMKGAAEELLPALAKRIRRATKYLTLSPLPCDSILKRQPESPPAHDEALGAAIQANDCVAINQRTKELNWVEPEQLKVLFNWAKERWDLPLLSRVLIKWRPPQQSINELVNLALEKGCFEKISYPVMLIHFTNLSSDVGGKVMNWLDEATGEVFQDLACDLLNLEETLNRINGAKDAVFVTIPKASSKEDLHPLIERIGRQIPINEISPDSPLGTAVSMWNFITDQWISGMVSPTEFQESIRTAAQILNESFPVAEITLSFSRSAPSHFEDDEKFDTSQFFQSLHQAIEANQPNQVGKLLRMRGASLLSPREFADLAGHSVQGHFHCLGEVLSAPTFRIGPDDFMGIVIETLRQKNWKAAPYLFICTAFKSLPFEKMAFLIDYLNDAPESIKTLFNCQIAKKA